MLEYILQIPIAQQHALASVRLMRGLKVAVDDDVIWLRNIPYTENFDKELWKLPAINIYTLGKDDHLFPLNIQVPVGKLPQLTWLPLMQYVSIEPPVSAIKGEASEKINVELARSEKIQQSVALMAMLDDWINYAETAPATRLEKISFAASENGMVLLMGNPLPSLPGKEYWRSKGLLIQCGYDFVIPLMAELIAKIVNEEGNKVVVFDHDGGWQIIDNTDFVKASRSGIRKLRDALCQQ